MRVVRYLQDDAGPGRVGILFAVPHELGSVLWRMGDVRRDLIGGVPAFAGILGGRETVVMAAGMGEAVAGSAGELLAQVPRLSRVWIAGYGGGLDPGLRRGDVVVAPVFPSGFSPPSLGRGRRAVAGNILHVSRVIGGAADKARLFRESGALCCEMESGVIGPIADRLGIPWGGVRAISDAASEDLPVALLDASWDARASKPTPGKLLWAMARRPRGAVAFLRFVSGLGLARENLGRVLEELVAAGPQ